MSGTVIRNIDDILEIAKHVKSWNWFARSVRNLINYCMQKGIVTKEQANELKSVLKLKRTGFDIYLPTDTEVKETLAAIKDHRVKILIKLMLYSGCRVIEGIKLLTEFEPNKLHFIDGVAYYDMNWIRHNKRASKLFMPASFAKQLDQIYISERILYKNWTHKMKPKHCRNWFANKLLQLGVTESVIAFMLGHSTRTTLTTHYLELMNNALRGYKKVAPTLQAIIN